MSTFSSGPSPTFKFPSIPTSFPFNITNPININITNSSPLTMASCIVCRGHAATLNSCLNGNPNITAQQSLIGKVFQSGGLSINSTEDISLPELLAPVAQCVCIPTFPQQYNDCMTCFNGTGKIPASGNTTFNLEDITAACQIEAQLLANTTVVVPSIGNSTTITTSSAPRKSFNSKKVLVAGLTIVALLAGNL